MSASDNAIKPLADLDDTITAFELIRLRDDKSDILVRPDDRRPAFHPIAHPEIHELYLGAQGNFWVLQDINMKQDRHDFEHNISAPMREFMKFIFAFFAMADKLISAAISKKLTKMLDEIQEAVYLVQWNAAIENIHSESYSAMIQTCIVNVKERAELYDSLFTMPIINKLARFMNESVRSAESNGVIMARMAFIEGVLFSFMFVPFIQISTQKLMPGVCTTNLYVQKDELSHAKTWARLSALLLDVPVSYDTIISICEDTVKISDEFIDTAVPVDLPQLTRENMKDYVRFTADTVIDMFYQRRPFYRVANPIGATESVGQVTQAKFFERTGVEYSKASVADDGEICLDV